MENSIFTSAAQPVFYIAEVGGNHEGDFRYALDLTKLAISSGAHAVKFQLYTGDTLVSAVESPDRNQHFKKFELTKEENVEIAQLCTRSGVEFMASVWDGEMLDWIDPFINFHKVGSGDLTCYPMLEKLVKTGKPIILSTGVSTMAQIEGAVAFIESLDSSYIRDRKCALLQCTSAYPTPDDCANVQAMLTLKNEFGLPVGYSDHTLGSDAIELAVSLGAEIIEKHFTDTRQGKVFRDHLVSLTKSEVSAFLDKARKLKTLTGKKEKFVTRAELDAGHEISFRRSLYALTDISAGEDFSVHNLTTLRPMHGICASRFFEVLGQTAGRDIASGELIREGDISN